MKLKYIIFPLCFFLLFGCARQVTYLRKAEKFSQQKRYHQAAELVKQNHKKYGKRDRVLYHLDRGILFLYAGDFDKAIEYLTIAEKEMDELFTQSLSKQAASLVTNEYVLPYVGLDYEQVLINSFLSLAFVGKGQYEEALVESRKVNTKFNLLKEKNAKNKGIKDNGFIRYLNGILYEQDRDYDNAYISYYNALKAYRHEATCPVPKSLQSILLTLAQETDRLDDYDKFKKEFSTGVKPYAGLGKSELIVVSLVGKGPLLKSKEYSGTFVDKKGHTHHLKFAIPDFVSRTSLTHGVEAALSETSRQGGEQAENILALCKKDLDARMAKIIAKTSIRVIAKTVANAKVKKKLYTKNPLANLAIGLGTDAVFDQFEHADTRVCRLFPGAIHIARIPVEPGSYSLNIISHTKKGKKVTEAPKVAVKAGEKRFVFFTDLR